MKIPNSSKDSFVGEGRGLKMPIAFDGLETYFD